MGKDKSLDARLVIHSKWILHLNVDVKTVKHPEETIAENPHDLEEGRGDSKTTKRNKKLVNGTLPKFKT